MPEIERRTFAGEVRAKDGDGMAFTGYAARFGEETYIGPPKQGFYERIAPGAFANALKRCDTRSLFNHNPDYILGRKSAGTLRLEEDENGLRVDNDLPDTQWGRDTSTSVARGDITGMSFAFTVVGEEWSSKPGGHAQLRTITEIGELVDVGPVTFPAYDTTSASVRSVVRKANAEAAPAEKRSERRQTEKRGLVAMVCATDAAVDAAALALAAGNLAQAMALLDAAAVTLLDADWYLWSTDSELLAALGCGDVDAALAVAWDAIAAAINVGDNAMDADGLDLTAALAATDQLLAALRLPDADAPATEDTEGDSTATNDDMGMERSTDRTEMVAQWLEAAGALATEKGRQA